MDGGAVVQEGDAGVGRRRSPEHAAHEDASRGARAERVHEGGPLWCDLRRHGVPRPRHERVGRSVAQRREGQRVARGIPDGEAVVALGAGGVRVGAEADHLTGRQVDGGEVPPSLGVEQGKRDASAIGRPARRRDLHVAGEGGQRALPHRLQVQLEQVGRRAVDADEGEAAAVGRERGGDGAAVGRQPPHPASGRADEVEVVEERAVCPTARPREGDLRAVGAPRDRPRDGALGQDAEAARARAVGAGVRHRDQAADRSRQAGQDDGRDARRVRAEGDVVDDLPRQAEGLGVE